MRNTSLIIVILTAALVVFGTRTVGAYTTYSQVFCSPAEDAQKGVENFYYEYDEAPIGRGDGWAESTVYLWRSADGAAWSILQRLANGDLCLILSGENWTSIIWFIPPLEEPA